LYQGTTLVGPKKADKARALALEAFSSPECGLRRSSAAQHGSEDISFAALNKEMVLRLEQPTIEAMMICFGGLQKTDLLMLGIYQQIPGLGHKYAWNLEKRRTLLDEPSIPKSLS
jgi:hypothetical protein